MSSRIVVTHSYGSCCLDILYNRRGRYAVINDVHVNEKHRGKRIGSQLIEKAIDKARELECYKVICTSRFSNTNAHRLYMKYFKIWGLEYRLDLDKNG